jgi:uncharacterized protein (DUF362 family)
MTVSLVRFDDSLDSLRKAIELCNGFEQLDSNRKILIKPNNCFRHPIMPPYGMVTTSTITELLVRLLLEHGCRDISIGEGAIIGIFDELAPYTKRGFQGTSINRVAKKYGIKLIDFNKGPFQELDLGGIKAQVSKSALEADFLINVPVLKTHFQTKVSLGFKNLKGCLSKASKKRFHTSNKLDLLIYWLNEAVKSDLVIIDGIYMLEKGPETLAGIAHRKDLIIASPDIFECDVIGTTILGIDPSDVAHLREFAKRHNRSFDISEIQIKGEDIESVREHLVWQFIPDRELLSPKGVTGLSAPYPGQTMCCACGATLALALAIMAKDNPKTDFGGAHLYYGMELKPERDARDILLYGNCAIKNSKDLNTVTRIEGCPPTLTKTLIALMRVLLNRPRMLRMVFERFIKLIGVRLGMYKEVFPRWERYRSKEFNRKHF